MIEEHYDEICDELWYIYTSKRAAEKASVENRGYSSEEGGADFSPVSLTKRNTASLRGVI